MRFLTLIAFGAAIGLAFLIYDIKYETRGLEIKAAALMKSIQEERENLAVARAEWSHAIRPEHVERLARAVLKFEPVRPDQIVLWDGGAKRRGASPRAPGQDAIAALIGRSAHKPARDSAHAGR